MYELVLWGDHTHYHAGTGMTSALILCVLHSELKPDTWPDNNVPSRFNKGTATNIRSQEPPTCRFCLEVAKEFDEMYEKQNAEYYGEDNISF